MSLPTCPDATLCLRLQRGTVGVTARGDPARQESRLLSQTPQVPVDTLTEE